MNSRSYLPACAGLLFLGLAINARAEDWPQWRHDPNRTAYSAEKLPATLHLQWVRHYPPREQVWDDPLNHDLMPYDKTFEPVVLGDRMFVGFNDSDKVVALDIRTGNELWRFYTDGPVRLPAAAWQGKVYFASDDGHLYCVSANDGRLQWKFQGAPSARKALGNRRVISAWPARGGPVIRDGTVYFAASIWPFMGTFIYALDAATGTVVWVNDGTGADYIKQPHAAPSFAGVAPQGALAATGQYLLVPGGRSIPAVLDRQTGKLLHFEINDGGKGNGGSFVIASEREYFVHTRQRGVRDFDFKTGKKGKFTLNQPVLGRQHYYTGQDQSKLQQAVVEAREKLESAKYAELKARSELRDASGIDDSSAMKKARGAVASARKKIAEAEQSLAKAEEKLGSEWAGRVIQSIGLDKTVQWELPADGTGDLIKAGSRIYAAGAEAIVAVEAPTRTQPQARIVWTHPMDAPVERLLAANGMLFAVTLDGRILAFSAEPKAVAQHELTPGPITPSPEATERAKAILAQADAHEGYALCFGAGDGALLEALAAQSQLHLVTVDADAAKVDQLRRRFDAAGWYGKRVTVHPGDPVSFHAPPFLANLVIVEGEFAGKLTEPRTLAAVYASVRPYGGTLWISAAGAGPATLVQQLAEAKLPGAKLLPAAGGVAVVRAGPVPGSADWTHLYGDMANTVKSDDQTVKLPLGVLWFGGNSNLDVLPRHGHGPSEQVVGGRLFIQGMTNLSARDVYTGRVLWNVELPELGTYGIYYDETYQETPLSTLYNQKHIPGANARGANYVATENEVYVAMGSTCRVLSARTGATLRTIALPAAAGQLAPPDWGFIGVQGDLLFGGTGFARPHQRLAGTNASALPSATDVSASAGLAAFNRRTGQLLWQVAARHGFVHNGIVAGNGRVYCLDRLPKTVEDKLKRRGSDLPEDYRVVAFDAPTGRQLWEQEQRVFGTWLGFSKQHDLLLQGGSAGRDRTKDEIGQGMAVYRGQNGSVVWTNSAKYTGPCILHHDLVITTPDSKKESAGAFNLLDGTPHLVTNPLTGQREPWKIARDYGCNYPVASEHLLTFRSGAAGFYDLETEGGTGNFGGFKSGCSANLIAANGVLNAPDYTRTCSCPYQNQTSLALVHVPEMEMWTFTLFGTGIKTHERARQLGINLGAPGDRRADTGTLWLEHPSVGGTSANVPVTVKGAQARYFRRHASQFAGEGPAWVAASGVRDVDAVEIVPALIKPKSAAPAAKSSKEDEDDDDNGSSDTKAAADKTSGQEKAPEPETALPTLPPTPYTVRLHFAEPDDVKAGDRVFSVRLQDREVLGNLDIVATAGGSRRGVVKQFKNVVIGDALTVAFTKCADSQHGPVICGIELIAEDGGLSQASPAVE